MEKMDLRKAKEDLWKAKEEACKKGKKRAEIWNTSLRHNGKQKKMLAKKKKRSERPMLNLFNEWEHIQLNMRRLSNALATETYEPL